MFLLILAITVNMELLNPDPFDNDTLEKDTFSLIENKSPISYSGTYVWDAAQGDTLITEGVPYGNNTNYTICLEGIQDMALGWFVTEEVPIDEWELVISNTGSMNKIVRSFNPMNRHKFHIVMRAKTTAVRTVKIHITKYIRPYD